MPTQRYEIIRRTMMGQATYTILDNKTGRYATGANTIWLATERCRKLNREHENGNKSIREVD